VPWLNGSVYDQYVVVEDAGILHRVTGYTLEEGGLGVSDQNFRQVNALRPNILCRAGKACADARWDEVQQARSSGDGDRRVANAITVHSYSLTSYPTKRKLLAIR
jgi:hypothetical protein